MFFATETNTCLMIWDSIHSLGIIISSEESVHSLTSVAPTISGSFLLPSSLGWDRDLKLLNRTANFCPWSSQLIQDPK